ncbi:MAG: hypothetical protein NZM31_07070 [Gemmatales bacterium]|nr:hypothetical protein [Gemmatales bacterium]MDW8386762.1 hypothetical protein [Gemmatales bacterium]
MERPRSVTADWVYDRAVLHGRLKSLGTEVRISRRRKSERGLGTRRWPMERTLCWLRQFRRLQVRRDQSLVIHEAFVLLACIVIDWRY